MKIAPVATKHGATSKMRTENIRPLAQSRSQENAGILSMPASSACWHEHR
jgi:hypothetical protein